MEMYFKFGGMCENYRFSHRVLLLWLRQRFPTENTKLSKKEWY